MAPDQLDVAECRTAACGILRGGRSRSSRKAGRCLHGGRGGRSRSRRSGGEAAFYGIRATSLSFMVARMPFMALQVTLAHEGNFCELGVCMQVARGCRPEGRKPCHKRQPRHPNAINVRLVTRAPQRQARRRNPKCPAGQPCHRSAINADLAAGRR